MVAWFEMTVPSAKPVRMTEVKATVRSAPAAMVSASVHEMVRVAVSKKPSGAAFTLVRLASTMSVMTTSRAGPLPVFTRRIVQVMVSPGCGSPPLASTKLFSATDSSAEALMVKVVGSAAAVVVGSSLESVWAGAPVSAAWLETVEPSTTVASRVASRVSVTVSPGSTEASAGVVVAFQVTAVPASVPPDEAEMPVKVAAGSGSRMMTPVAAARPALLRASV